MYEQGNTDAHYTISTEDGYTLDVCSDCLGEWRETEGVAFEWHELELPTTSTCECC